MRNNLLKINTYTTLWTDNTVFDPTNRKINSCFPVTSSYMFQTLKGQHQGGIHKGKTGHQIPILRCTYVELTYNTVT